MLNLLKKSVQNIVNHSGGQVTAIKPILSQSEDSKKQVNNLCANYYKDGYKLEYVYVYKTLEGKVIYWRLRLVNERGDKIIRPIKKVNEKYIFGEPPFPNKKPIFGQEELQRSNGKVFLVEGENKVIALRKLYITAVTSGGANSVSRADWSPVQGRHIIIWPDHDQPGKDFAKNSADILLGLGCTVQILDIEKLNLPVSGDVVDWLKENPTATQDDVMALAVNNYPLEDIASYNESASPVTPIEKVKSSTVVESNLGKPYPVDALPSPIRKAVEEVVNFIQCPLPIAACSALANISLVTQGLADVQRTNGLDSPSSLYFLVIADSGERKTSIDKLFSKPILDWEKKMLDEYNQAFNKYSAQTDVWDVKEEFILNNIKTSAKNGKDTHCSEHLLINHRAEKPIKPVDKFMLYADGTAEGIALNLYENYKYGGIFTSEGGVFFGSAGMQKDASMKYLSFFNIMWDGGCYKVARKISKSYRLDDARLAICIAVQKNTLKAFMSSAGKLSRDTGFIARFLLTDPHSTQGNRMFKAPPKDWPALESYNTRISELLRLIDTENPREMLKLSDTGFDRWVKFHDKVEKQLAEGGDFSEIKDVASKAADNCARLASVFHVFENGPFGEISFDHVDRASRIIEWHLYQSKDFLSTVDKSAQKSDAESLKEWLIKECRKTGANAIKYSNVLQSGPSRLRNKDSLIKAIEELSKTDILKLTDSAGTMFIDISPSLLSIDATNDSHY